MKTIKKALCVVGASGLLGELLSNVVYGHIESSGGLLNRNHFNSIFESCAFNDFGQVTKAS